MIERGFDWLARLLFVMVALALFALAITLVVSGVWQLARGALSGEIGIYNLMSGVGVMTGQGLSGTLGARQGGVR